jgi:hypothetical protein
MSKTCVHVFGYAWAMKTKVATVTSANFSFLVLDSHHWTAQRFGFRVRV